MDCLLFVLADYSAKTEIGVYHLNLSHMCLLISAV